MGNAASNEAQQPRDATALGRPRSHGGATSQPATPGGSSLGRGWSRHGSIRRGASQTPVQNPTRNPFSREGSAGPSQDRQLSTIAGASTSAQARRPRADSASTATGPRSESLTPNASRERAATSSFDTPATKPSAAAAGRSASISVGLSSHLLKRPTKQGSLQSSDLQDAEGDFKEHPKEHEQQGSDRGRALAPALDLATSSFGPQTIISPHLSPSIATDAQSVSGTTSSHLSPAAASPQMAPSTTRPFGRGVAAIFANAGQSSGAPATSMPQHGTATEGNAESDAVSERMSAGLSEVRPIDAAGRQLAAALPSYLKIPTLIPSNQEPAPPSTALSSPGGSPSVPPASGSGSVTPNSSGWSSVMGTAGRATDAVLTTEEVIIAPGDASKVSSPAAEDSPETPIAEDANRRPSLGTDAGAKDRPITHEAIERAFGATASTSVSPSADVEDPSQGSTSLSRTPTPTQKSHAAKALTPARLDRSESTDEQQQQHDLMRKVHLETGIASGTTTPVMPIPPGLTSAPPSAMTPTLSNPRPQVGGTSPVEQYATPQQSGRASKPTAASGGQSTSDETATPQASSKAQVRPPAHLTPYYWRNAQGPLSLMPIVLNWRGGGKEVFVTGTFANEWRSKILLKRTSTSGAASSGSRGRASGAKEEHTVVLHLPPGTHRMKFIVDDRWRVSRELPTATDGDGNLVNYLEIPNVGPAHPGPLSAPGEDLLDGSTRESQRRTERGIERVKEAERAGKRRPASAEGAPAKRSDADDAPKDDKLAEEGPKASAQVEDDTSAQGELQREARRKAVLDLREEARKAELLRNGQLEEVFGVDDEALRAAETWVQTVPEAVLRAQEEDEEYRERLEAQGIDPDQHRSQQHPDDDDDAPSIPPPPSLPRQLEKVILNSSPANPALVPAGGLVDDNSILPAPNHVVLNHLTASAIKGGVLAVGTTTRYKRKYVTTVFYRPVQT